MTYVAIVVVIALLGLLHFMKQNDEQIEGLETVCIGETCVNENQVKAMMNSLKRSDAGSVRPNITSFKVGGHKNRAYPVVINTMDSWSEKAIYEFTINRANVHTDGSWQGSMLLEVEGHATRWGHGSNFLRVKQNKYNRKRFVPSNGGVTENFRSGEIVVYLRGGYTYKFYGIGCKMTNTNTNGSSVALSGKTYKSRGI
jgi:hypothetical protein